MEANNTPTYIAMAASVPATMTTLQQWLLDRPGAYERFVLPSASGDGSPAERAARAAAAIRGEYDGPMRDSEIIKELAETMEEEAR